MVFKLNKISLDSINCMDVKLINNQSEIFLFEDNNESKVMYMFEIQQHTLKALGSMNTLSKVRPFIHVKSCLSSTINIWFPPLKKKKKLIFSFKIAYKYFNNKNLNLNKVIFGRL